MPPDIGQYISLTDAAEVFKVSTKTLRRQRDRLKTADDPLGVATFVVRTRDGEVFEKPGAALVAKLTKEGRIPEWMVNHQWLRSEYGPRSKQSAKPVQPDDQAGDRTPDQPRATPTDQPNTVDKPETSTLSNPPDLLREVMAAKDAHILELQKRLDNAETEKEAMRAAAAQERSIYSRMLGPGDQAKTSRQTKQPVDTTPKPQPVQQRPRKRPAPKTERRAGILARGQQSVRRFMFGGRSE